MRTYDRTKLPQWAQEEMSRKDREIASLKRRIAELAESQPDSNVQIEGHTLYPDHGLPPGSAIIFYLDDNRRKHVNTITARIERGKLHLRGDGIGPLMLQPSGGVNTIDVSNTGRRTWDS